MLTGEMINVSNQNAFLKSYNKETKQIIKSKILGIIRKEDAEEYKVSMLSYSGKNSKELFSGSPKHRVYAKKKDKEFQWMSLKEISESKESIIALGDLTPFVIVVKKTGKLIPIVDVWMENSCYFSEGVLSHNSGGNALKFYASQRLDIRRIGDVKANDIIVGNRTRVKVVKNKLAPPKKIAEFNIMYGKGIDRIQELLDLAIEDDLIVKGGAWYKYEEEKIQGEANAIRWLKENKEIRDKIEQEVLSIRGLEV